MRGLYVCACFFMYYYLVRTLISHLVCHCVAYSNEQDRNQAEVCCSCEADKEAGNEEGD